MEEILGTLGKFGIVPNFFFLVKNRKFGDFGQKRRFLEFSRFWENLGKIFGFLWNFGVQTSKKFGVFLGKKMLFLGKNILGGNERFWGKTLNFEEIFNFFFN